MAIDLSSLFKYSSMVWSDAAATAASGFAEDFRRGGGLCNEPEVEDDEVVPDVVVDEDDDEEEEEADGDSLEEEEAVATGIRRTWPVQTLSLAQRLLHLRKSSTVRSYLRARPAKVSSPLT